MVASSQYSLDKDMWGLLMALGSLALGLALFLIAQGGQKLSKDEMYKLRHFIVDLKFPPIKEVAETQKVQI
jgi:predicted peroxiredoxin